MKNKIDFGWQSQEERLKRHARLSAKKRVEWLYEMQLFTRKFFTPQKKKIFWKLRQANAWGQGNF